MQENVSKSIAYRTQIESKTIQSNVMIIRKMKIQSQNNSSHQTTFSQENPVSFFQQFKQQILKAWLPVPTLSKTIILFFVMSAIFLGIGIPMIIMSNQIIEVRARYDNLCTINSTCSLTFQIPFNMQSPVFVYYEINNYYQNHRLYATSLSNDQLAGSQPSVSEISTLCKPIVTNADLWKTTAIDGTPLDPTKPANPCGMIAYTIFNDTFSIFYPNNTNISSMTTDGIAWPSDIKKYKKSNDSLQWWDVTDPRFMNWMRVASLPDFRKLYARINEDLPAGQYSIQITNNYDISFFGSTKYFVLSTANLFGGKNTFLAVMYLIMGSLCLIVGILFLIRKYNKKDKQG